MDKFIVKKYINKELDSEKEFSYPTAENLYLNIISHSRKLNATIKSKPVNTESTPAQPEKPVNTKSTLEQPEKPVNTANIKAARTARKLRLQERKKNSDRSTRRAQNREKFQQSHSEHTGGSGDIDIRFLITQIATNTSIEISYDTKKVYKLIENNTETDITDYFTTKDRCIEYLQSKFYNVPVANNAAKNSESANSGAKNTLQQPVNNAAKKTEPANSGAKNTLQQPVNNAAKNTLQQPVNNAAKITLQQPVNNAEKNTPQQPANNAAKITQPANSAEKNTLQQPVNNAAKNSKSIKKKGKNLWRIIFILSVIVAISIGFLLVKKKLRI
jgi:hypothetical protein